MELKASPRKLRHHKTRGSQALRSDHAAIALEAQQPDERWPVLRYGNAVALGPTQSACSLRLHIEGVWGGRVAPGVTYDSDTRQHAIHIR